MTAIERSAQLEAYAGTFGKPDIDASSRMRKRLRAYIDKSTSKQQRRLHWAQAAAVTAVVLLALGALAWWQSDSSGNSPNAALSASDEPQHIELRSGARLTLLPGSAVVFARDDETAADLRLEAGEVELKGLDAEATPTVIRVGNYAITPLSRDFSARMTSGVPLVTVREGVVTVAGPDLPAAGVRLVASTR